ncbi:PREDICTED: major facilitator superfamily domain-containing protein 1-like [Amphimedon queenslandica]|uniref:Lysosomal dipeptide transporter MFSD1 n=1 Tax=Amphimedon queenslandica TaxID=400682 RepID=A0A1X7TDW6_AMPQE|nr:PREDICTED: major facilitator superfamily domain-containing protein 1-like [Amphimedon queenslandica]|eukprot:XP_011407755.1 PREDICTED: major facilitator superfamily domain-containing protein 1-like [Amphimedon queenslandica]
MSVLGEDGSASAWYNYWVYKYLFLFFLSSVRLLSNYCLELPSGIEDTIIKVMGVTTAEYDLLFSVSAWPNIFLCLVGGVLVDKLLGRRLGLLLFVICLLLGQIVWGVGGLVDNYIIMLVGRFFIGAGNELIIVIDHSFKATWFKEDLSLAISIDIGFSRLGGTLAILLPQLIYDSLSMFHTPTSRLGVTILTAAGFMIIAMIFSVIVIQADYMREKSAKEFKSDDVAFTDKSKGIKQVFSFIFLLSVSINMLFTPVLYSFVSIAQKFFVQKYGLSIKMANIANGLLFGSAIVLTPVAGMIISKVGFHLFWVLLCNLTTALPALLMFMFSNTESYIPFIAGIFYSLSYTLGGPSFTALPALVVDKEYITTGYGILRGAYNASLSAIVYITGFIIDTKGYFMLQAFFVYLTILCIHIVLLLIVLDFISQKPRLNVPGLWIKYIINK